MRRAAGNLEVQRGPNKNGFGQARPTPWMDVSGCLVSLAAFTIITVLAVGASFYVTLYLVVTYAIAGPVAYRISRSPSPRERPSWAARYGALLVLSLPLLPYAWVEVQTLAAGPALFSATRQALIAEYEHGPIMFYKVLAAAGGRARVYVVVPCPGPGNRTGLTYDFVRTPRGWRYTREWNAVWSDCGSAEGNVFPPYFGAREF
jgi:hypothetical protein